MTNNYVNTKKWLTKFVDLTGISDSEFAEKMTFA